MTRNLYFYTCDISCYLFTHTDGFEVFNKLSYLTFYFLAANT